MPAVAFFYSLGRRAGLSQLQAIDYQNLCISWHGLCFIAYGGVGPFLQILQSLQADHSIQWPILAESEMSTYVYIAFNELRKSPIPEEAWLSAVHQCDELVVEDAQPSTADCRHVVRLKKDRRASVCLDRFGIAAASDPSKELVGAMFKVASYLGADVYSARFNKYTSTDDWVQRTTKYRREFERQRAYKEKKQLRQIALWCAACAGSVILGSLAGSLYMAFIG